MRQLKQYKEASDCEKCESREGEKWNTARSGMNNPKERERCWREKETM
jgi:hypothetical protein